MQQFHNNHSTEHSGNVTYNGKCQYKTGKCYNERTLKRNGEAHSLCEEHRLKQNMIQRRSDRKYQTVHAMRRRERSQRRAVLKRQVSMAVAQQLFFEHQQHSHAPQIGEPMEVIFTQQSEPCLPSQQPLQPASTASTIPDECVSVPAKLNLESFDLSILSHLDVSISPSRLFSTFVSLESHTEHTFHKSTMQKDDTPTGVEDFSPESFLSICMPEDCDAFSNIVPLLSVIGEKHAWTEEDVDFLQALIL